MRLAAFGGLKFDSGQIYVPANDSARAIAPVVFNEAFTQTPTVTTSPSTVALAILRDGGVSPSDETSTGFNVNVYRTGTTGTYVNWIAIGR